MMIGKSEILEWAYTLVGSLSNKGALYPPGRSLNGWISWPFLLCCWVFSKRNPVVSSHGRNNYFGNELRDWGGLPSKSLGFNLISHFLLSWLLCILHCGVGSVRKSRSSQSRSPFLEEQISSFLLALRVESWLHGEAVQKIFLPLKSFNLYLQLHLHLIPKGSFVKFTFLFPSEILRDK